MDYSEYSINSKKTIKKIASLFYLNYEGEFGYYSSFRNVCQKNIISMRLAIPGKGGGHIKSTPYIEEYSEEDSESIRNFICEKIGHLKQIEEPKLYEVPQYFRVVYTDGSCDHYQFDDDFFEVFKMYKDNHKEKLENTKKIISVPYLIFEDINYSEKIKIMDDIATIIKNKKITDILSYATADCTLEEKYNSFLCIKGKTTIEKEIKKRSGFMKRKLSKAHLYTTLEGSLNESGESIVKIKIEAHRPPQNKITYLLEPVFNESDKITNFKFTLFKECDQNSKTLYGDGLSKAKQAIYNDYKIE
ncbi:MAG: hypothetical protein IJD97_06295 [Clostridia bacterium]|nr:hypothetical protein [Clostridia bacterium]